MMSSLYDVINGPHFGGEDHPGKKL